MQLAHPKTALVTVQLVLWENSVVNPARKDCTARIVAWYVRAVNMENVINSREHASVPGNIMVQTAQKVSNVN